MDWQNPDIAKQYKAGEVVTSPFALHLIQQCGLDRADGSSELVVLDNACGTGVVTLNLYEALSPAAKTRLQVVCGDFSPGMVKSVQERIDQSGWAGASAKVVDAQRMDLPSDHFTHVITNFALFLVPDPRACLAECFRVLRPSGTNALTIWKRAGWHPVAVGAAARIPGAPPVPPFAEFVNVFMKDRGENESWTDMKFVEEQMRKTGFEDVKLVLHQNLIKVPSVAEYMKSYAGMTMTMLRNVWSDEEMARASPHFEAALLEELTSKYGDGEVPTEWEAWCITARVPADPVA
ncbi:S-adenosyl-L-methionine-dependent methyltransferase [Lentinus tigrinus ALCF2SS1-7]|uniref:S-adenosyl-L-methionine-dependent methyltransferase n=1 Tax=Lentinus tigrinus ALCF2SS1-6 TaxID=1328759 RepID=A0A5C2S4X6_9APHY|nr:S-adenosyl-L-methionine-dependent methyltransferase [Lentinus tigrinus ALCF2SS1-6]RPD72761.1 S-adenosyl-L-methionine-dependent methyltransferase [Lentinus tigrinus ALCF2SS1-7]